MSGCGSAQLKVLAEELTFGLFPQHVFVPLALRCNFSLACEARGVLPD